MAVSIEFKLVDSLPGDQPVMATDDDGVITYYLNRAHDRDTVAAALCKVATACAIPYYKRTDRRTA